MTILQQLICIISVIILLAIVLVVGCERYSQRVQRNGENYIMNLNRRIRLEKNLHQLPSWQIHRFCQRYMNMPENCIASSEKEEGLSERSVGFIILATSQLGSDASLQFGWRSLPHNVENPLPGQPILWLLFRDDRKHRLVLQIDPNGSQVLPLEAFTRGPNYLITTVSRMDGAEVGHALKQLYRI